MSRPIPTLASNVLMRAHQLLVHASAQAQKAADFILGKEVENEDENAESTVSKTVSNSVGKVQVPVNQVVA